MNKILLIIRREYLSRVKKKSFIVMTFLVPGLFIAMYAVIIALVVKRDDFTSIKTIEVVDDTGNFRDKLQSTRTVKFHSSDRDFGDAKRAFKTSKNDYLLYIPADKKNINLLSRKKPGLETISLVEDQLNRINKIEQLLAAGIDTSIVNRGNTIEIAAKQITEEGEKDGGAWLAYGIGLISALLIYMSLFIYGVQVMRGVIEEKVSRIIEVVISSVKPFQLMMGKIIGVGMVGLTQFLLWILLTATLAAGAGALFIKGKDIEKLKTEQSFTQGSPPAQKAMTEKSPAKMEQLLDSLKTVNWTFTLGCFLFYFLFGFLLYSSVFAAVGSAVDSETDAQQFMLPVTMPLIFTFILSMNFVISNPDSRLSFWLSIIPFTSPITMMIRIPFGVPAWELALSMLLLTGGFVVITWIAARIYRVGILIYGKKAGYKELVKWFVYKE
jgi:ABC-2 type transport system permease protein